MTWIATFFISLATATYIVAPFLRRHVTGMAQGLAPLESPAAAGRGHGKAGSNGVGTAHSRGTASAKARPGTAPGKARAGTAPDKARKAGPGKAHSAVSGASRAVRNDAEAEAEILIQRARQSQTATADNNSKSAATWTCSCGRVMPVSDRFCGSCGVPRVS